MKLLPGMIKSMALILALIDNILCEQEYVVDHESFEALEGDEETLIDLSQIKCIGRERFLNGTLTMVEDMDDDNFKVAAELFLSSSGNSNYKKIGLDIPKTGSCEAFKKFYIQFLQPSFEFDENTDLPIIPDEGLCPFPKGTYYAKDISLSTEKWPNRIPYGTLKVVTKFYKNDAFVGGFILLLRVQSK